MNIIEKIELKSIFSLLEERLVSWYEIVIKSIPNIIASIFIILIFIFLAKLARKVFSKVLPRISKNEAVTSLLDTIIYFIIILIGFFVSLEILNLDKTVTSLLAGAGVLGLALGFAFQEIASNFVSGIFIAFREPYKLGDIVQLDQHFGKITNINLRTTSITTFQGLEIIIPNKHMFTKPFTNFTTTPKRRIDIEVGVSYEDNLEKVEKVTKEALLNINEIINDEEPEVFFKEFSDSSINLVARIWIHYPENQAFLKARHKAIINIKKHYDKNGISIPFPIRTIVMDKTQ
ncbi:MAG: mechanosensitive ion channel family protein [Bdellovibrionota bacterium]|nr:mechanosensitive ion channel family protein [Bdellovibrionota bacterium]